VILINSQSKITKSIFTWLICLAYAGLFFPIGISNITLITLFLFCLLQFKASEVFKTIEESPFAKLFIGMYSFLIIGLLYTSNLKIGLFMLEKKICFLLFPFLVLPLVKNINRAVVMKKLGIITIVSSLLLLCIAIYRKFVLNDENAFFFDSGEGFEGFSPIHYVYYAMYFGCGSLIFIDSYFQQLLNRRKGWMILMILFGYCLSVMTLVASKTGIGAFLIASISLLFFKLQDRRAFIVSLLLIGLMSSTFLFLNKTTRNRFEGLTNHIGMVTEQEGIKDTKFNGLNMRLMFWKIQVSHSWKDNTVLFGQGTGDNQDYIDSLYKLPQYSMFGYVGWDSHNQWVYTFVQIGLVGVILMAILFFVYFRKAIIQKDTMLLCFLLITLGFSLTESILESNKGIVFFSLFMTLFSSSRRLKNPPH